MAHTVCYVDRHGHFTLKQLRLSLVNETHTKPYTGPRLYIILPILPQTNTQAKYQNGISYHLLLCFLAENETVRFISS